MSDQTPITKISLTVDERLTYRASINLLDWGFEALPGSGFEFKNADFFKVIMGDCLVLFSSKTSTTPVEYDKLEKFLLKQGYVKKIDE